MRVLVEVVAGREREGGVVLGGDGAGVGEVFVDDVGEVEARVCFVVVLQAVEEQSFEDDDAAGGAVEPGGVFVVLSFEAEAEFVDFYRDRSRGY